VSGQAAIEVVGTAAGYMLAKLDKPKKRKPSVRVSAGQSFRQAEVVRMMAG
jgi:hypothetical protein